MAQILLVDDDPLVGKTLVDLLSLHGYAATRAESAERALELLAGGGFALALLALRPPTRRAAAPRPRKPPRGGRPRRGGGGRARARAPARPHEIGRDWSLI